MHDREAGEVVRVRPIERVSASTVSLGNLLLDRVRDLPLTLGEVPIEIDADARGTADPVCWIALRSARHRLVLGVGPNTLDAAAQPYTNGVALDGFSRTLRKAVVVAAMSEFLDRLEDVLEEPLDVDAVTTDSPAMGHEATTVDVCLSHHDRWRERLSICCSADTVPALARHVSRLPPAPARLLPSTLAVSVRFVLGDSELPPSSFADLTEGDLILMENCFCESGRTVRVLVGTRHHVMGRIVDRRVQLVRQAENDFLNERTDEPRDDLERIAVPIVFEIGTTMLTLAELGRLREGHVFDVGPDSDRPVAIRSEGRLVGHGELVEINGKRLGVRLLELAK